MKPSRRERVYGGMKTPFAYVVVGVLLAGCQSDASRPPQMPSPDGAASTRPAPQDAASQDAAVLHTVLLDVLTFDGENAPRDMRYGNKDQILVAPRACQYKITRDRVLLYQRSRSQPPTTNLSMEQNAAAEAAAEHLIERFEANDVFAPLTSSDPRIQIQNDPATTKPGLRDDRPICVWPPGYAAGGDFAVVRLSIPWSIHSGDATYLLENRDGTWTIIVRDFVWYF